MTNTQESQASHFDKHMTDEQREPEMVIKLRHLFLDEDITAAAESIESSGHISLYERQARSIQMSFIYIRSACQ